MNNQITSLSSQDIVLENLQIIDKQEKLILYLVDQLLNEYSTYRKIDSRYRLYQAKSVLHNIQCWYEDSPEKPFNYTLLDVYEDIDNDTRLNKVKDDIVKLIKSKL